MTTRFIDCLCHTHTCLNFNPFPGSYHVRLLHMLQHTHKQSTVYISLLKTFQDYGIIHPLHRMCFRCQSNSLCMNMYLWGQTCKYIHSNQPIRYIPAKYLGGPPWRGPLMLTHVDEGPWKSSVPPSHTDNQNTCKKTKLTIMKIMSSCSKWRLPIKC